MSIAVRKKQSLLFLGMFFIVILSLFVNATSLNKVSKRAMHEQIAGTSSPILSLEDSVKLFDYSKSAPDPGDEIYASPIGNIYAAGLVKFEEESLQIEKPRQNQQPTILSFAGPVNIEVNKISSWVIGVADPEDQDLTFTIFWGDGENDSFNRISGDLAILHKYNTVGTKTIKISVKDTGGLSDSKTFSIRVNPFLIGARVRVTSNGNNLNIRPVPSTKQNALGSKWPGDTGVITGGPENDTEGNDFFWWKVKWDDGKEGWSVEDYLEKIADSKFQEPEANKTNESSSSISKINSPAGGETWQAGKPYTIAWVTPTSFDVNVVNISLVNDSSEISIATIKNNYQIDIKGGGYNWIIPNKGIAPGSYRIKAVINTPDPQPITIYSNLFSIINISVECVQQSNAITCESRICGIAINNCGQNVSCGTCDSEKSCNSQGQCVVSSNICGDTNSDKSLTIIDLENMRKYAFGGVAVPSGVKADLNGDGVVNVLDVVIITNYLERGGSAPVCASPSSCDSGKCGRTIPATTSDCGNVNGDNKIDSQDVDKLTGVAFRGEQISNSNLGDLNKDGIVDILDVNILINYIYRESEKPSCFSFSYQSKTPGPNGCGDLNQDGKVDQTDLDKLKQYASGGSTGASMSIADLNGDGILDILDVSIMINYLGRNGSVPSCKASGTVEGQPPTVLSFIGPSSLMGLEYGEWQATASDLDSVGLSFIVDWGDGSSSQKFPGLPNGAPTIIQKRYASEGSYTITLKVEDDTGKTSSNSKTLQIAVTPIPSNFVPTGITILSPVANMAYFAGDPIPIKWTSQTSGDKVWIYCAKTNSFDGSLSTSLITPNGANNNYGGTFNFMHEGIIKTGLGVYPILSCDKFLIMGRDINDKPTEKLTDKLSISYHQGSKKGLKVKVDKKTWCGNSPYNYYCQDPPTSSCPNLGKYCVSVVEKPLCISACTPDKNPAVLGQQTPGAIGTIVDDIPVKFGGSSSFGEGWFWNVNFDSGVSGWIDERVLVPADASTNILTSIAFTLTSLTNPTSVFVGDNNKWLVETNIPLNPPASGSLAWDIDWGDGSAKSIFSDAISSYQHPRGEISHIYSKLGTYTIKVSITSSVPGYNGTTTKSLSVNVAYRPLSIKQLTFLYSTGLNINTRGRGLVEANGGVDPLTFAFDWGDGISYSYPGIANKPLQIYHTYDRAGTWNVQLTVTDGANQKATKTMAITTLQNLQNQPIPLSTKFKIGDKVKGIVMHNVVDLAGTVFVADGNGRTGTIVDRPVFKDGSWYWRWLPIGAGGGESEVGWSKETDIAKY